MPTNPPPRLLLITESPLLPNLETLVTQALGGAPFDLLLRDYQATDDRIIALAQTLKPLLHAAGGRLLIHNRLEIAVSAGADGLHLPESGVTTREARTRLGPLPLLGRSCHEPESARKHLLHGGDYVTLSPVFATLSHPDAFPLGTERFAALRRRIPGPVLALGGIGVGNVQEVMAAGATGVALIRGIFQAPNPAQTTQELFRALQTT
ncbi:MAG: thiamine phosphate synthase [Magnetococcales bacterium]|nr:thiamine phosphate synthase [Magnetococcales bacterium]